MWVRKRIDIGWRDLLSGAANCCLTASRSAAKEVVEGTWANDGRAFACLSVRSGLDLVLKALQLPAGSEVLISAITIPDMVRIIEHHGLVPVPIDLNDHDLSPQVELLENLRTPKTKAMLLAHLLGGRFDLNPFVDFACRHRLFLLEDCAQAFEGNRYRGHDSADVSMFSFGPIKTATALGGALFRVRERSLLKKIRELQSGYPVQSRWIFLRRVLLYSVFYGLGGRIAFAMFFRLCRVLGKDLDRVLNGSVRNFPQAEFFKNLRQQPSLPLLQLMARRIARYPIHDLDRRSARGKFLARLLPQRSCPGCDATPHSFWIFPLRVTDASAAIARLHAAGFDATAVTSLQPVERRGLVPQVASRLLVSAIYLPLYPTIPETELRRMARTLTPFLVNAANADELIGCPRS